MAKEKQRQETETTEEKPHFLSDDYSEEIDLWYKNKEGEKVQFKAYYDFELLPFSRVTQAKVSFSALEQVLEKPPTKASELDHVLKQEFEQRGLASILHEKDEDGDIIPLSGDVTNTRIYKALGHAAGKELNRCLGFIRFNFMTMLGLVPTDLTKQFQSTTKLLKPVVKESISEILTPLLKENKNLKDMKNFEAFINKVSEVITDVSEQKMPQS